ncbi:MAG: phytoene desaturase family protein [Candidatus Lokiarchaeia archaeon]
MGIDIKDEYDVIILGGGITGLMVGNVLQKNGFSTLIVEKMSQAGGKCSELNWHGVKFDHFGKWDTITGTSNPKEGAFYRACREADVEFEFNQLSWKVGFIKKGATEPEYASIDDWRGGKAMLDFAKMMTGIELNESQKEEFTQILEKMASYSKEDLMTITHLTLKEWVDQNIKDELVKMFFNLGNIVTDTPADEYGFSHNAWMIGNLTQGKSVFATIGGGSSFKTLITPLVESAQKKGVDILTNYTAQEIVIKDNAVDSVWIMDNSTFLNYKIKAKNIIVNIPLYDAYPKLVKDEMLNNDELKYIKRLIETYTKDLSCYFILEKDTIKDLPGHFHAFDVTSGIPIYIGEIVQQKNFGAIVPDEYDYLQIYIPGGRGGGYLDYEGDPNKIPYEKLEKIKNKILGIISKWMIPGFNDKILYSAITWSPNFGRYCVMAFPTNIETKSKKINGLYFASDTIDCTCIGKLGLEKCGEVALRCTKVFLKDNG